MPVGTLFISSFSHVILCVVQKLVFQYFWFRMRLKYFHYFLPNFSISFSIIFLKLGFCFKKFKFGDVIFRGTPGLDSF